MLLPSVHDTRNLFYSSIFPCILRSRPFRPCFCSYPPTLLPPFSVSSTNSTSTSQHYTYHSPEQPIDERPPPKPPIARTATRATTITTCTPQHTQPYHTTPNPSWRIVYSLKGMTMSGEPKHCCVLLNRSSEVAGFCRHFSKPPPSPVPV